MKNARVLTAFGIVLAMSRPASAQTTDPGALLLADKTVVAALERAKLNEPEILAEQVRVCEIPAPPFGEEKRGLEFKNIFTRLGLQNVRIAPRDPNAA